MRPWPIGKDYYADRTACSKSWLDHIHRSPAHLRAYLDGLIPSTPRMRFGSLVHSWVLEPDSIGSRYIQVPNLDRRRKADKEAAAILEAQAEEEGKTLVDNEQWEQLQAITSAVYRHPAAAELLRRGEPEQGILWDNPDTSELCKARADWLRENHVVDLKTTSDASPGAFARSMVNYRYPVQAAHYLEGFSLPGFIWIAVEIDPPYGVAVYADSDEILAYGACQRDPDLRLYAECKARNQWPGYPDQVQSIELPRWAKFNEY